MADSDDDLKEMRDFRSEAEEADHDNREEAIVDLEFEAGKQWDDRTRSIREGQATEGGSPFAFPLPCLTINNIPQIIGQVVGDRMANETSIKVLPREDGDKEVADVRSELIRSIELQSKAQRVYAQAFGQAVGCGMGHFRVDLDYAYEDAFERDLFIRAIPNPLAVLADPLAADPTLRDATRIIVEDRISEAEYERRFPKASKSSSFDTDVKADGWCDDKAIRIGEYWRLDERNRTIALMQDGSVRDVTDEPNEDWRQLLFVGPDGTRHVREAKCKYATMQLSNGQEWLTDPFELRLPRIPIIRVTGREVWVGDKRVRYGLTRFARDPARFRNFWRSVIAELLMTAPRANFFAQASAVKGREDEWLNALVYNDGSQAPTEITGLNLSALLNEAAMCAQDMKDVTGIHDASLGIRSNETSGIAIQRRQHEGDIATIGYHHNMNAAQQEAGDVLNALIPICYDTARTIRTIGADGSASLVRINDPKFAPSAGSSVKGAASGQGGIDLAQGRYDVVTATGPAYMTRRQEAVDAMTQFAQVDPMILQRAGDLMVKAMDMPDADAIAERLRPPGTLDPDEMTPQQQQAAQQAQQQQQMQEAMQMRAANAELAAKEADVELKQQQARKAAADADKSEAEAEAARYTTLQLRGQTALQGAEMAGAADAVHELEGSVG